MTKWQKRILLIITNSLNTLLVPLFNVLISLLVVRLASAELWGVFVQILIAVQFAAHVLAWGNKQYLLRDFSFNPTNISQSWQSSLISRLTLFLGCVLIVSLSGWSLTRTLLVLLWILMLVIYQSFDVLALYKRAFVFSIVVEIGEILVLLAAIGGLGSAITVDYLVLLFCGSNLGKTAVFAIRFWRYVINDGGNPIRLQGSLDFRYFSQAFPFFMMGFAGMLMSRMDLYSVSYFLPEQEVGQYQIFINLMIYLQTVASLILLPFVKNIYRLDYDTILKISSRLFVLGLLLVPLALPGAYLALTRVYNFNDLSPVSLMLGGLYVLPVYFYAPIIYALYKANLQNTVVRISLAGSGINLLLNIFMLPQLGMIGALVATSLVQWFVFALYLSKGRALQEAQTIAASGLG